MRLDKKDMVLYAVTDQSLAEWRKPCTARWKKR